MTSTPSKTVSGRVFDTLYYVHKSAQVKPKGISVDAPHLEYDMFFEYMLNTCDLIFCFVFCELYRRSAAVERRSI